jgi:ribose-phosphate pyrophosphokinase
MKYLNLSKGLTLGHFTQQIVFEKFVFPGGEPHIKIISKFGELVDVTVSSRLSNSDDVITLHIALDALFNSGWLGEVHLTIPYFPGARQDRRMTYGEPLSAKVYANMINDWSLQSVSILDPHSDVTPALLENVEVITNHKFIEKVVKDITALDVLHHNDMFDKNLVLVSPDAGAEKKIHGVAKAVEADAIIKCSKIRDVNTGRLSGFQVHAQDLAGLDCLIVDDICDGGGTFIGLAEELKMKKAGKLYLAVTHGIFSKGLEELEQHFETIYTTDSWFDANETYADTYLAGGILKQFKLHEVL